MWKIYSSGKVCKNDSVDIQTFGTVCCSFNLSALISANEINLKPLIFVSLQAKSRAKKKKKICDEYA